MNDNARKWVEALRSGEFEQMTGQLRGGAGMCCLGVACEVYRREVGRGTWLNGRVFQGSSLSLPPDVARWLGIRHTEGRIDGGVCLTGMNDAGSTFAELATFIESEPPGLFVPSPT